MLFEVAIDTPDGSLRGRVAVPEGPMRLAELAYSALEMDQRVVAMAEAREKRAGRSISCCKGCGACCRQLVPLSPPEAWFIADLIEALPEARRAAVLARFDAATRAIDGAGLRERLGRRPESDEAARALSMEYFAMGVACPFLEEEACSIHVTRPSICREYMVTSPPVHCGSMQREAVRRVPVSILLSRTLAHLTAELLGGEPELIALPLAPAWAAARREEGRRTWDGRMLLERLLGLLSGR